MLDDEDNLILVDARAARPVGVTLGEGGTPPWNEGFTSISSVHNDKIAFDRIKEWLGNSPVQDAGHAAKGEANHVADGEVEEARVYQTLTKVCEKEALKITRKGRFARLLQTHANNAQMNALIQRSSISGVAAIAAGLSQRGVFQTGFGAQARLLEPTTSSTISPVVIASPDGNLVQSVASTKPKVESNKSTTIAKKATPTVSALPGPSVARQHHSCVQPPRSPRDPVITLQQVIQHPLLTHVQSCLEEVCYQFASQHLQAVLEAKSWNSAQAVELTRRSSILEEAYRQHPETMDSSVLQRTGFTITAIMHSVSKLRHAAVHREVIPATDIETWLDHAVMLVEVLRLRHPGLTTIRDTLKSQMCELHAGRESRRDMVEEKIGAEQEKLHVFERSIRQIAAQEDQKQQEDAFRHVLGCVNSRQTAQERYRVTMAGYAKAIVAVLCMFLLATRFLGSLG